MSLGRHKRGPGQSGSGSSTYQVCPDEARPPPKGGVPAFLALPRPGSPGPRGTLSLGLLLDGGPGPRPCDSAPPRAPPPQQKFSLLLLRAVSNHRSSSPHCDEDTPPHAAERVLHLRSVLPPPVPKKREREGEGEGRPGRAEGFILMKICAPNSGPDPQGPGEPCPWADEEGSGPRWLRARHTRCKMRPVDGRPERHYI